MSLSLPCQVLLGNSISAIKYLALISYLLFFSFVDFPLLSLHVHVRKREAMNTVMLKRKQCGKMKKKKLLIRSTTATNYSAHSGLQWRAKNRKRMHNEFRKKKKQHLLYNTATMTKKNACTHC